MSKAGTFKPINVRTHETAALAVLEATLASRAGFALLSWGFRCAHGGVSYVCLCGSLDTALRPFSLPPHESLTSLC